MRSSKSNASILSGNIHHIASILLFLLVDHHHICGQDGGAEPRPPDFPPHDLPEADGPGTGVVPADLGGENGLEVGPVDPPNPTEPTYEDDEVEPIDDGGMVPESTLEEPEVTPEEIPASQPDLLEFPLDWDNEDEEDPTYIASEEEHEEQSEYDKYTPEDKALPLEPHPKPMSKSKCKGWKDIPSSPMESTGSDSLQLKLAKKALAKLKKEQEKLILSCIRIAVFFSHFTGLYSISLLVAISKHESFY